MARETIAVDVDEVLFPFVAEFVEFDNTIHGGNLTAEDFFCYEFESVIGIPQEEAVKRVYAFNDADHSDIDPLPATQDAIWELADRYDLTVVTARHPRFAGRTHQWINSHFEGAFSKLIHIGYHLEMKTPKTKAAVCHELGAVALIDDSLGHVTCCAEGGVEGVLFGNYPWNQAAELPEGVTRCEDWPQVLEYFDGRG